MTRGTTTGRRGLRFRNVSKQKWGRVLRQDEIEARERPSRINHARRNTTTGWQPLERKRGYPDSKMGSENGHQGRTPRKQKGGKEMTLRRKRNPMQVGNPPPRGDSIQGEEGSGVQRDWVPSGTPGLPTRTPRGQPGNREDTRTRPTKSSKVNHSNPNPGYQRGQGTMKPRSPGGNTDQDITLVLQIPHPSATRKPKAFPIGTEPETDNCRMDPDTGPGTRTTTAPNDDMSSTADEDRNQCNAAQRPSGEK